MPLPSICWRVYYQFRDWRARRSGKLTPKGEALWLLLAAKDNYTQAEHRKLDLLCSKPKLSDRLLDWKEALYIWWNTRGKRRR